MRLFAVVSQSLEVVSSILLLSLVVGFVCVSFTHVVPTQGHTGMMHHTHAPAQAMHTCCDRDATTDHMELWKGTFVGIPALFQDVLAFFGVGAFVYFVLPHFLEKISSLILVLMHRWMAYIREHPNVRTFNQLQLSFARGILHPKTY